ncbi:MAG: TetR/AcrR family transcriptional regulator [Oscillospiraceae bacterium]|nr:TetR/AcrR family transcriptional regulator [Oscillospiraceae bacterium]
MATYENGTNTRQAIIDACKTLFYNKGFHETGFSDICETAHVNRGTIYYHFENKETIRYEVLWEYIISYKHICERFCPDARYHYIISMYLFWDRTKTDEKLRRFVLEICQDYPIYTGKLDMSHFHFAVYDNLWGNFMEKQAIPDLSFASVYGYVMSCLRMICEHPEHYDTWELFEHCVNASTSIWGVPQETLDQIWSDMKHYISMIPKSELSLSF